MALCQEALGVDKPKPTAPAKPKKPARERTMSALVSTLAGMLLRAGVAAKLVTDRQGELCTVPEEGRLQLLRALLLNLPMIRLALVVLGVLDERAVDRDTRVLIPCFLTLRPRRP